MESEDEALHREVRRILTVPDRESENLFNPQLTLMMATIHGSVTRIDGGHLMVISWS